jgi:hypothetical protein
LAGEVSTAERGVTLTVAPGIAHDWWNPGRDEALVRVEVRPSARFEAMISNAFGLAQDGKVNKQGVPNLLPLAMHLTRPPRIVQRILFALLAPPARQLGYRGSYPEYLARGPTETVQVEQLDVAALAECPAR